MRKSTRIVLAILCAAALGASALWLFKRPVARPAAPAPAIPVKVISLQSADVPRFVTGIGTVQSLQSVVIRAQVDGILNRVHVTEGQHVKAGDLLATLDDRAIRAAMEQARAQLAQSQAQLDLARLDLARYKELSRDNGISRQTYDQQQAQVVQLGATVQGNKATLEAAQVQLSYTRLQSPVSGRVGIRNVDEGNFLRVSDASGLFTVTRLDPVTVEFSLPQQMLPLLQRLTGQTEQAPVQAWLGDDANGTLLGEGRLSLIDNQVAPGTGTIRAKALFDNPAHSLWPGQLVTVKIQTGLERNALKVAPTVVQRGMDQHFVFRIRDNKAEVVPVKVLYQDSDMALISGPAPGDVLVADGQSRLKAGSRVDVTQAQATTPVADSVPAAVQP